jgi:hypothetical protein
MVVLGVRPTLKAVGEGIRLGEVRDRATLEHAAAEAEGADKKDSDVLARLERIETMIEDLVQAKEGAGGI